MRIVYDYNKFHNGKTGLELFSKEICRFNLTNDLVKGVSIVSLVTWPISVPAIVIGYTFHKIGILRIKDYIED